MTRRKTTPDKIDLTALVKEVEKNLASEGAGEEAPMRTPYEMYRWRTEHKLPPEPAARARRALAVDLFGYSPSDLHAVKSSYRKWEIPEYVVREPLAYEKLCRSVWLLRWKCGLSESYIQQAIGIRDVDVTTCLAVYSNHLDRCGVLCTTCGIRTDPKYGTTCCEDCRA